MGSYEREFIVNKKIEKLSRVFLLSNIFYRNFNKIFENDNEVKFERKEKNKLGQVLFWDISLYKINEDTLVNFKYETKGYAPLKKTNEKRMDDIVNFYQSNEINKWLYSHTNTIGFRYFNSKEDWISEVKKLVKEKFNYIFENIEEKEVLSEICDEMSDKYIEDAITDNIELTTYGVISETQKILIELCNFVIHLIYNDEKMFCKALIRLFDSNIFLTMYFKNDDYTELILKIDENKINDIKMIIAPAYSSNEVSNPFATLAAVTGLQFIALTFLTPLFVIPTSVIGVKKINETIKVNKNSNGIKWIKPFHKNYFDKKLLFHLAEF